MKTIVPASKGIIIQKNKLLLVESPIGEKMLWDLPGGKMKYGETPAETLKREIKEELAITIQIIHFAGFWWFYRMKDEKQVICLTFLCTPITKHFNLSQNPAKHENITSYKWVNIQELLEGKFLLSHASLLELLHSLKLSPIDLQ